MNRWLWMLCAVVLVACGGSDEARLFGASGIVIDAAVDETNPPGDETFGPDAETTDAADETPGPDAPVVPPVDAACAMPLCTGDPVRQCSGSVVNECGATACDGVPCERGTCSVVNANGKACSCVRHDDDVASGELCNAPGRLWGQMPGTMPNQGCLGCKSTGIVQGGVEWYCCD